MKYILFFFILLAVSSCTDAIYENINIRQNSTFKCKFALSFSGEKIFSPDGNTPSNWMNTFISQSDSAYWVLYNSYSGELNNFDLLTQKEICKKQLPVKNTDGIAFCEGKFYIQDYKYAQFFRVDSLCQVDTIAVWRAENYRIPPSRIGIFNGVYSHNNLKYIVTYTMGEYDDEHRKICMEYDELNRKVKYYVNYPEFYAKANWGQSSYRTVYSCYNPSANSIIFSFPASHNVVSFNCQTKYITEFYAGSSEIRSIKAYSNKKSQIKDAESVEHYLRNNSYGPVFFDKYRKLFYRIAEMPYTANDGSLYKSKSIIILDMDLNVIGESLLGPYYGNAVLIEPEGILVPYINSEWNMDKPMVYHCFRLKLVEK